MKNRRIARIIAVVLALIMAFSLIYSAIATLTAGAVPTQAEIDRLREEKREYERRKQEIQSHINTIEFERMTEVAKKRVLDDRIMLTGLEIDNIDETIAYYEMLISEKEIEVLEAQARENLQLRHYRNRVRDMEENGVITYLEILFDSTSFSDMLARLDFISDIMRADEAIYNDLITARNETEAAVAALEQTKLEMEEERAQRERLLEELEEHLEEANVLIAEIEASLETENALYLEVDAEAQRIQSEINAKVEELRREEERRAAAAAAAAAASRPTITGSGVLGWPVPSVGRGSISSEFGTRLHPVFRVYRQHWGIDIGASHGANIVASDRGRVITSAYNSSYGNYVVISHGNGMTTLYAHMSSRRVSEGDVVEKGQVIGLIGSTGVSTGPHLHFEVSINGQRVNPARYL